jgi:hypothetical protein
LIEEVTTEMMDLEPSDLVDQGKLPTAPEQQMEELREEHDPSKALPPGEADNNALMTPEEMERLYDQFEMDDDVNDKFDRIGF